MSFAIRIHDNARGVWYNPYPEGEQAIVQEGAGNLSIHIGVHNTETVNGRAWLRLIRLHPTNPALDEFLIDYTADPVVPDEWHNFEITTDMLSRNTNFQLDYWFAIGTTVIHETSTTLTVLYIENPNPPPNGDGVTYPTQEECEAAGWYWYNNACHATPAGDGGTPDIGVIVLAAGIIILGVGVGWYLWKGRK